MKRFGKRKAAVALFVLLCATIIPFGLAQACPGDLDPAFDEDGAPGDGIVLTDVTDDPWGGSAVLDLVVQPADGKIVAVGYTYGGGNLHFALVRYLADGRLDPDFGAGGKVMGPPGIAQSVLLQHDGKIVVAGCEPSGPGDRKTCQFSETFVVARYRPENGALDTGFSGGVVRTDVVPGDGGGGLGDEGAFDIALDPVTGNLVAAGVARTRSEPGNIDDFALVRYLPDGTLDGDFDADGKVVTQVFNSETDKAYNVVVLDGGKILAGGYASAEIPATGKSASQDFALARFNPNGSLDGTFGSRGDGTVTTAASDGTVTTAGTRGISKMAVQNDGKIVAVGRQLDDPIVRYMPDGTLDPSFGAGGMIVTGTAAPNNSLDRSVAIQTDGKLLVAGSPDSDFVLIRYNPNGTPDVDFGIGGRVITDLGDPSAAFALTVQPDGKAVVGGITAAGRFALARYLTDSVLSHNLTLSPPTSTRQVGTAHTVAATLEDPARAPLAGSKVRFSVSGANLGLGEDVTDANGQASFSYTGLVTGQDTITAFADLNDDLRTQSNEPQATATQTWTVGDPGRSGGGSNAPAITSIDPVTGPVIGGTKVSVNGVNLGDARSVLFGDKEVSRPCGGAPGSGESPCFTLASANLITVYSPSVPAPALVHVRIRTSAGMTPESSADLFEYTSAPPPPKVEPAPGPPTGGLNSSSSGGVGTGGGLTPGTPGGSSAASSSLSANLAPGQAPVSGSASAQAPVQVPSAQPVPVQVAQTSGAAGAAFGVEQQAQEAPTTGYLMVGQDSSSTSLFGFLITGIALIITCLFFRPRVGLRPGREQIPDPAPGWARC